MEWDESQEFPIDLFHKMGALGLMGVLVPHEYRGLALAILNTLLQFQKLPKLMAQLDCLWQRTIHCAPITFLQFGNAGPKKKILAKAGHWRLDWCMGFDRTKYRF